MQITTSTHGYSGNSDSLKQKELEQLSEINNNLTEINRKTGWYLSALVRGILTGFGYIIGAFIAVLIIGWVLNIVGIIPSLTQQAQEWKDVLNQAQNKPAQTK